MSEPIVDMNEMTVVTPIKNFNAGGFHPLPGLTQKEQIAERTKVFRGNGTPYLKVPGLRALEAVRVGTMPLPLKHRFKYPDDPNNFEQKSYGQVDLVALEFADDGTAILLRNVISNHGKWQKDVDIFVTGEWGDSSSPPPARTTPPVGESPIDPNAPAIPLTGDPNLTPETPTDPNATNATPTKPSK